MTTNKVEELMKEARDEKLKFMVNDVCNFYPKGDVRNYALDRLTNDLTIEIDTRPVER